MTWWGWLLVVLAAWLAAGALVGSLVGRRLRRVSADYPAPDDEPGNRSSTC
jgi:uncharacterized membrane protein YfcA